MKHKFLGLLLVSLIPVMGNSQNIFLNEFATTHQMTPFDKIQKSYYEEAVDSGIAEQRAQIDNITRQRSMPDFDNTIVALENCGATLNRVLNVFYPLLSADADDELMEISTRIAPKLSELSTDISLNEQLWERIKYVYDNREKLGITGEDLMLLQNTYDGFARSGANLQGDDREEYRKIESQLSQLTLQFSQNCLKEQNK